MSSFVPRRIEHQQRKMNHLRNDGEFVEKKWNQKESTCVTKKCTFSKSSKSRKEAPLRFPETVFGREGVNDVEKRLRWSSYAAARVLYSTFLLHYLAVFGGVLDDHRLISASGFCSIFLPWFELLCVVLSSGGFCAAVAASFCSTTTSSPGSFVMLDKAISKASNASFVSRSSSSLSFSNRAISLLEVFQRGFGDFLFRQFTNLGS